MGGRIVSLQLLRFIAATMVVWHHSISLANGFFDTSGPLGSARLFGLGGTGIDIFFVISGFVIALNGPLAERRPTAVEFYARRWARIAPLFYLLTIPTILTWPFMTPVSPWGAGRGAAPEQWIATIFFWPSAGLQNVPPFISNGWTLCFEMLFYSAMAIILIGGRLRLMASLTVAAVALLTIARSRFNVPWLQFVDNKIILEFFFGIFLAIFRKEIVALGSRWGLVLLAVGSGWLIAWGAGVGPDVAGYDEIMADFGVLPRTLIVGVPAALIVAGAVACDAALKRRRGLFDRLGDASYAIFLSHGLTLLAIYLLLTVMAGRMGILEVPPSEAAATWVILWSIVFSVVAGYLWYGAFDRPIMAFFRTKIPKGLRLGPQAPALAE